VSEKEKILEEIVGAILEIWQYGNINDDRGKRLVKIEKALREMPVSRSVME